ncbi:MAG TPA: hypothetical protein VMR28_01925 [Candidatus Saccharimonadales bacterium]|nr:hypothetical protein [Candidatus Saccharimonadales bacterium]
MKTKFRVLFTEFWLQLVILVGVVVVLSVLLLAHLGTQPAALSASEVAARTASRSLHTIWSHPINAPFTILQHFAIHFRPVSIRASRLVAALYGGIALILLFIVLRFWHGNFAAGAGTAMCATSAWFLGTARLGTPNVLLLSILALMTGGLWMKHTLHRNFVLLVGVIIVGAVLYVPGIVWFILAALIWQRQTIFHELKHITIVLKSMAGALLVVLLIPLGWAIFKQPSLGREILGLPAAWPGLMGLVRNLYHIPLTLFAWAPANPTHWLGHLPLLDVFEDAMFVFGLYSFWVGRKLGRSKYLLGTVIVGIILIVIGGAVTITILLPAVYITIAVGVLYIWELWLSVFPHNPVARSVGMTIVILAVIVSCNYQLRRYFIAWPYAPATQAVFTHKPVNFDTITTLHKE